MPLTALARQVYLSKRTRPGGGRHFRVGPLQDCRINRLANRRTSGNLAGLTNEHLVTGLKLWLLMVKTAMGFGLTCDPGVSTFSERFFAQIATSRSEAL